MTARSRSIIESRHFEQKISKNADQAEFQAILSGSSAIDAGFYDDEVAGVIDDFEQPRDEAIGLDWHQREIAKESAVGSIQEEVQRRREILGRHYPFVIRQNSITYRPSGNGVYEFCLAAALQSDISKKPFAYIPRAFEKISAAIVAEFAGEGSLSYHTGAPRLGSVPARFDHAMAEVAKLTGEWAWNTAKHYPEGNSSTGDEGLDFVVAKRAGDQREGQLFLIGQCACGDDWEAKWNDLNLDKLGKWFHPLAVVRPVRVFTTPHILSNGNLLDCQVEAGMVFDRLRLTAVAAACSLETPLAPWPPELRRLTNLVIRSIETPLPKYVPPFELAARSERV